jgi:glutamate-5-semialdehyde dehydrogenase
MRVPLGVIAVIYESRPNVTIDIAALCIKSGNAVILRGGEESIHSNLVLAGIVQDALESEGYNRNIVSLMSNLDRDLVPLLLKRNDAIDIVIPRGGEGLVRMVTEESRIPLIKHEKGLCHLFIDESADETMANAIALNGKVQRPGVCNAIETILVHEKYPHIKSLIKLLADNHVEIRGCERTLSIDPELIKKAVTDDWATEYLDLIVSVKTVESIILQFRTYRGYSYSKL